MDKIVNGITYNNAKFLRTTCKTCGKILSHSCIVSSYGWCNKKCKKIWIRKKSIKGGKKKAEILYEREQMKFGSGFDNCSCQNEGER